MMHSVPRTKEAAREVLRRFQICADRNAKFRLVQQLHEAMKCQAWWPSGDQLRRLDSAIADLWYVERKAAPRPFWRAYHLINARYKPLHIRATLDGLIKRVSDLLTAIKPSRLAEIERYAQAHPEKQDGRRLLDFVTAIRAYPKNKLSRREWNDYYDLLRRWPNQTPTIELKSKLPHDSAALWSYAHALELLLDDNERERILAKAELLLRRVAYLGNPGYYDVLLVEPLFDERRKFAERNSVEEKQRKLKAAIRTRVQRSRSRMETNGC